jgi:steroid delta-isomerase-like uncharacterized protein
MYDSLLHEWFDQVWNQGNMDAVHRILAPDAVVYNLAQDGKASTGPAGFLPFFTAFRDAFPDLQVMVHQAATEGDIVAGRWEAAATHTGHGFGFPATGKAVSFCGMSMARIANGQIVEAWNVWDVAALNNQLGFTTTPPVR